MVFLTASKRITSLIGSPLLRFGLAARRSNNLLFSPFGGGGSSAASLPSLQQKQLDTPYLDMALLIPFAQKLLSLALYDESQKVVSRHVQERQITETKGGSSSMLESLFQQDDSSSLATTTTTNQELSELRVQAYDEVIRKSLLPMESASNLQAWMGHLRILKWARAEFLISKYGPMVKEAMDAYPQLRASPQFQRNPNHNFLLHLARGRLVVSSSSSEDKTQTPMVLPTTETIIKAFDMKDWTTNKNSQGLQESTLNIRDKLVSVLDATEDDNDDSSATTTTLQEVTTEELLHCLSGGHVQSCGPLNAICEEANLYQLWTKEYVQHLGDYLLQEYASSNNTTILDIGAGDGLLIRYLQVYMEGKLKKTTMGRRKKSKGTTIKMPTMISTDDGSWGIFAKAKVEKLNVQGALQKYANNDDDDDDHKLVVLCSWMPQQVDWTAKFRQSKVHEYILIGEADDGSCGHGWDTWGNPIFAPSEDSNEVMPAFEQDGYQRWDMDSLIPFQFSRFDSALSRGSKTVSFRRTRNAA